MGNHLTETTVSSQSSHNVSCWLDGGRGESKKNNATIPSAPGCVATQVIVNQLLMRKNTSERAFVALALLWAISCQSRQVGRKLFLFLFSFFSTSIGAQSWKKRRREERKYLHSGGPCSAVPVRIKGSGISERITTVVRQRSCLVSPNPPLLMRTWKDKHRLAAYFTSGTKLYSCLSTCSSTRTHMYTHTHMHTHTRSPSLLIKTNTQTVIRQRFRMSAWQKENVNNMIWMFKNGHLRSICIKPPLHSGDFNKPRISTLMQNTQRMSTSALFSESQSIEMTQFVCKRFRSSLANLGEGAPQKSAAI